MQAEFVKGNVEMIKQESALAISAGDIEAFGNGVKISHADFLASDDQGNYTSELAIGGGQYDVLKSAAGPAFAVGDDVWWDNTNNLAKAYSAGYLYFGKCTVAAASGDTSVRTAHVTPGPIVVDT